MSYIFFYFKCAININDNFRITCRKTKMSPLNITLFTSFCIELPQGVQKACFSTKT